MKILENYFISFVFLGLIGCASDSMTSVYFNARATPKYDKAIVFSRFSADSTEASKELQEDFNDVLAQCAPVMSRFEEQADRKKREAFFLAFSGLVAGSVVAPALTAANAAANAAWIAGLSGYAGATNYAQQAIIDQGLSSTVALKTRETIREEFNKAIRKFIDESDNEKRKRALQEALAACVIYAVTIPNTQVTTIPTGTSSVSSETNN